MTVLQLMANAIFRSKFVSFVETVRIKCAQLSGPIGFSCE